jgi:glycosyltransferase involved in cell wall biosynthesis
MQRRIDGDDRFRLRGPLPHEQLLPRLQAYDLAVIPSTWLETGPLTVLESFAAGLPVAGSDLGGIAELLRLQPGSGWLLPLRSSAWARLLRHLLADPQALALEVPKPRAFTAVAAELQELYASPSPLGSA